MIWLSFARWSCSVGPVVIFRRIYFRGKWTPFVRVQSCALERRRHYAQTRGKRQ